MPLNFSGVDEYRIVKLCERFGPRSISLVTANYPPSGPGQGHVTSLVFGKQMLISRKRCKIEIYLQWKTNRKSYMACQIAATVSILNFLSSDSCNSVRSKQILSQLDNHRESYDVIIFKTAAIPSQIFFCFLLL